LSVKQPAFAGRTGLAISFALGAAGQLVLTFAFRYAQAAVVASVGYSALVWSVAMGWIMFGHVPDAWSVVGMAVIAVFGVLLVLRR